MSMLLFKTVQIAGKVFLSLMKWKYMFKYISLLRVAISDWIMWIFTIYSDFPEMNVLPL